MEALKEKRAGVKKVWEAWAAPRLAKHQDPERVGTPRGEPIGLSKKKYHAVQTQVLHSKLFSLAELAKESEVSPVQIRVWRTEAEFKKAVEEATRDFVQYLSEEALKAWYDEQLINTLLYCLAMHKDGLLTLFFRWNREAGNIFNKLKENIKDVKNYQLLFDNMAFLGVFIHKFVELHPPDDRIRVKDVIIREFWPHIQMVLQFIVEIMASRDTSDEVKAECKKIILAIAFSNWVITI
jgi:hypothetical protein